MVNRQRAVHLLTVIAIGFSIISMRIVQLQLVQHDKYEEEAIKNHWEQVVMPARRGTITDTNGNVLAESHMLRDIHLDFVAIENQKETLPKIAAAVGRDPKELLAVAELAAADKLKARRYWLLASDQDEDAVSKIMALKVHGVRFEEKYVRQYPNLSHASHVIGFLDASNRGASGIEREMENYLSGIPGERWIEKDARQAEIAAYRQKDQPATEGFRVTLTIDLAIQHVVEVEMDRIMAEHRPKSAYIIAMRPATGEILAMANRPTFDPNERTTATPETMGNLCLTSGGIEPGSTFKIVTAAAAFNEGIASLDTPIYCYNGAYEYGGKVLHDHGSHGWISVRKGIETSSNICAVRLAMAMGQDRFFDYIRAFGFGKTTGLLGNQGESRGIVHPVAQWSKLSIARIPIGQGVGATPLQMVNAMCVIANGGNLMAPQLVKSVTDAQGRAVESYQPRVLQRVVSEKAARDVTKALTSVVDEEDGTGKNARIEGVLVAGKTGTAQVSGGKNGYLPGKYVGSFIGFFPAENPQIVIAVMVDQPSMGKYYGGLVAAPSFSAIGKQVIQILNIPTNAPPGAVEELPVQQARL